ncbi:unnamed protein product, partial [Brassica oleracea var. botrytis]
LRLRLRQCFEKFVFLRLTCVRTPRPAADANKTRGCEVNYAADNVIYYFALNIRILFSKLTQPCSIFLHLHLRYRHRALSSPSHTATSSLISISIFDVDLELSHLHLRRRPRALSSLTQHELSLLLRFGFQAYYWKEVLEERRKINWVLAKPCG